MAKGTSFAAKSKGKNKKTQSFVKYVKSIKSEKTGHWRFNEQMIALNEGENLDSALKRLKDDSLALDMDMPVFEEPKTEELPVEVEKNIEPENESEDGQNTTGAAEPVDKPKEASPEDEKAEGDSVEESKAEPAAKKTDD